MTVQLKYLDTSLIEQDIEAHPAWLGRISGLKAEKLLRGRNKPYLYVLRAGEFEKDYYVTYILPDFSVKHQPFIITMTDEGWSYSNGGGGGPYLDDVTIQNVLHLIMHCQMGECTPLINFEKR